jgi:hypothetical protein
MSIMSREKRLLAMNSSHQHDEKIPNIDYGRSLSKVHRRNGVKVDSALSQDREKLYVQYPRRSKAAHPSAVEVVWNSTLILSQNATHPVHSVQTIKKLDNSKIETKLMGVMVFYFKVDDGQRYTFLSDHMAAKKMEEMEIGKDKLRRIPLHKIYTRLIDISSKIVMFSPTEETNLESTAHAIPNHVPVYIVDKKGPTAGSWSCLRIFFTKQDRDAGWDALTFENKRRARRRETTFFELLEDMRGEDAHSKVSYDEKTQFVKPFYQKDSY